MQPLISLGEREGGRDATQPGAPSCSGGEAKRHQQRAFDIIAAFNLAWAVVVARSRGRGPGNGAG